MNLYDLGHGGADPGAVANGLREAEVVTEIGHLAAAGTRALGHHIGLTRLREDEGIGVERRKALVTSPVLQTVISLHANAAASVDALGWEIFVSAHNEDSKMLGNEIAKELMLLPVIKPRFPAVKTRLRANGEDFYYIINEPTKMGIAAVLVEVGFLTNEQDAAFLRAFWNRFALAYRITMGLDAYIQLKEES